MNDYDAFIYDLMLSCVDADHSKHHRPLFIILISFSTPDGLIFRQCLRA